MAVVDRVKNFVGNELNSALNTKIVEPPHLEADSAARLSCATVVGDFSKALSLPGLRLGWIVERDRDRRREYLNAREYLTVSNTPMGEFLGEIAIRHHHQVLARTREVTYANLALLESVIAEHADVLDWVRPQGGMTGFARLVSGGNARLFCQAALERGLLLAPGDCWGVPDHFRIGFGVGREWYPHAMSRFSELPAEWCPQDMQALPNGCWGAEIKRNFSLGRHRESGCQAETECLLVPTNKQKSGRALLPRNVEQMELRSCRRTTDQGHFVPWIAWHRNTRARGVL